MLSRAMIAGRDGGCGNRDEVSERALADAFAKGGWEKVTRLYRNQDIPEERCWVRGSGWCLAYS
jgi:protein-L-isoaspartate(D-aspartate) O-methyltransferase